MMTQRLLLFCAAVLLSLTLNAQTPEWARTAGGPGEEYAKSLSVDAAGNVYTAGIFQQTADFDPSGSGLYMTAEGSWDVYVQKHDAAGNVAWAIALGGPGEDRASSIAVDAEGSVMVTGWFSGTADFDPGTGEWLLTSAGGADVFFCKFNASGELLWAKSMGATADDKGQKILSGPGGDIWLIGEFQNTVDFNPADTVTVNLTSGGGLDVFVCRLDTDGHFVWAKNMGGLSYDSAFGAALDPGANVLLTGYFQGTADFDPSAGGTFNLTSAGSTDVFAVKLDPAGDFVWAGRIGGPGLDLCEGFTTDAQGNVYMAGYFNDTADFDPSAGNYFLTSDGADDAYVCKWDTNGQFQWAVHIGGLGGQSARDATVDPDGNVCVIGVFQNTVDLDPGSGMAPYTAAGNFDTFIVKLDPDGQYLWSHAVQGPDMEFGLCVRTDDESNIYACGSFNGSVEADTQEGPVSFSAVGSYDSWIIKFSINTAGCNTTATLDAVACGSFMAPGGAQFTASGTYVDIIPNAAGCDSLITINLIIIPNTFSTINATVCASYDLNGTEYFESGTYQQIVPNAGGCDSTITLNLTVNPLLTTGTLALLATANAVPAPDMTLELFDTADTGLNPAFSTTTDAVGMAVFENIPFGDYLCRAKPDATAAGQENLLTTYTNEQFHWTAANILTIGCDQSISETIELIVLSANTGPGEVSGTVYYTSVQSGLPVETANRSFLPGDPIPGVPVIIGLDSIGSANYTPVGITLTDAEGAYAFDNLGSGFYSVLVDMPGTPMVQTHYLTIDAQNTQFFEVDFFADESVGIYINDIIHTAETENALGNVSLFPNPAAESCTLIDTTPGDRISLLHIGGSLICGLTATSNAQQMDLRDLPAGLYIVMVQNENRTLTRKLVVR